MKHDCLNNHWNYVNDRFETISSITYKQPDILQAESLSVHIGPITVHVPLSVSAAKAREEDGRCVYLYKCVFVSTWM